MIVRSLKNSIIESLLDDEDEVFDGVKENIIKEFLEENYNINGSYTIKEKGNEFIVNVKGNIRVKNKDITSLTNDLFEFGSISGNFHCHSCYSLTSLKGAPKEVGGRFNCTYCESLKTLEGAPKKVEKFDCSYCDLLTSLEGVPEKVGGVFSCACCDSLKTLKGAPKEVGEKFDCGDCKSLKSLEGAPDEVGGDFVCSYCDLLPSLKGSPKKVGGDFCCNDCGVKFTEEDVKKYTIVSKKIYI